MRKRRYWWTELAAATSGISIPVSSANRLSQSSASREARTRWTNWTRQAGLTAEGIANQCHSNADYESTGYEWDAASVARGNCR